jgi:hypothetical protein
MDSHDRCHRLLAAFLAGEFDPADAPRWDEHLLACEQCWQVVREDRAGRRAAQVLRRPPPPGLADRVAFAVELAAAGTIAQRQPRRRLRLRWRWLAAAGALAAAAATAVAVLFLPGGRGAGSMPAAIAAVARYAEAVPSAPEQGGDPGWPTAPVEVGHPVTVAAGGQRMVLRVWRLGRVEAVVAVSAQQFPMPGRAHGVTGPGMAWTVRLGNIGLYCRNGRTSELVAAPVPEAQLAVLAARLPPA